MKTKLRILSLKLRGILSDRSIEKTLSILDAAEDALWEAANYIEVLEDQSDKKNRRAKK